VSTTEQTTANQLIELRQFVTARGWVPAIEYIDEGISGSRESRPALDSLIKDAKRRRLDVLVVWRLDRLGRSLRHLLVLLDELCALGVAFVSLGEGIDTSTPAGRLQLHVLGALAEFERERLRERVIAGMRRAKRQGKHVGRPRRAVPELAHVEGLTVRQAATALGVSPATAHRWLSRKGAARTVPPSPGLA
jgi:DNA invertase Pin-like site-specific DNA recombinase